MACSVNYVEVEIEGVGNAGGINVKSSFHPECDLCLNTVLRIKHLLGNGGIRMSYEGGFLLAVDIYPILILAGQVCISIDQGESYADTVLTAPTSHLGSSESGKDYFWNFGLASVFLTARKDHQSKK